MASHSQAPIKGQRPGPRCSVSAVKKSRIDAVLADRGLFPSRSAAAGAVRAGEVRIGQDGPVALRPSQLVEPDAKPDRRRGPALRLPRRDQAGERARGAGDRRRRPRLPRRRRLHRRLHRLPAAARRRAGRRGRRRLRPARRAAARRPARPRDRAAQRPGAGAGGPALRALAGDGRRLLHLADQGAAGGGPLPGARRRDCWRWSSRSSSSARSGSGGASSATPPTAARRSSSVAAAARELGLPVRGFASSGLPGPKGNRETFVWCGGAGAEVEDLEAAVAAVVEEDE